MAVTLMRHEEVPTSKSFVNAVQPCTVCELRRGDENEVLEFLALRPLHTVFMASLIRDNGITSPRNRGSFYACRGTFGQLEGVALMGHATLMEAASEASIAQFARLARNCQSAHLIRGEREIVGNFWKYYAGDRVEARRVCSEILLEQHQPSGLADTMSGLRRANLDDLEKVLAVNALMAFEEGGISPLQKDPGGFRRRTARRIEQGRIWVWIDDNRLMFKADIIAATRQAIYLEGVYVHPEERRKGHGLRCLNQLSANLLQETESLCLTTNEKNQNALKFYEKAGYEIRSHYETIYLR